MKETTSTGANSSTREQLTTIFTLLAHHTEADTSLRAGMKLTVEPSINIGTGFARWVDAIRVVIDTAVAAGDLVSSPVTHRLAWNLCAGTVGAANASATMRDEVGLGIRIADTVSAHLSSVTVRAPRAVDEAKVDGQIDG